MPYKTFMSEFFDGIIIGTAVFGTIFGFLNAAFWMNDKICDQDEQIEELSSRLDDCEKKDKLKK